MCYIVCMMNALVEQPATDIQLSHTFKDILPDVDEFFLSNGEVGVVNTINSFCDRVKKLADKYALTIDPDKFKGGAFELFVEYLCRSNASDNRIGIYNYAPVQGDADVGVDGHGIGENKHPATVQAKFRAGDYILTANADSLSNFLVSSWSDFGVRMEDDKNMLIITTGQKVLEETREKMLKGKVRVINRDALREMLDKRPEWWTRFYAAVKASTVKAIKVEPQTLREHQVEAADSVKGQAKGKIILPTGTGKTRVEGEIARQIILEKQKEGVVPLIKFNSSRILLCFQLFEDVFKYLNSHGIKARYMNFNSGRADEQTYIAELSASGGAYREIVSTTVAFEVVKAYKKAQAEGIPLVVFSTYHSSEKWAECGLVPSLTLNDEAHNLVSSEFSRVAGLPSEKTYFLTATEKVTDSKDDLGMNNPKIFGDMLYVRSPKYMIHKGEMVPPHVHLVREKSGQTVDLNKLDRDYDALVTSVAAAFFAHQRRIKEISSTPAEIGAKVLVVCRGQEDLIEMFNTKVFDSFRKQFPKVHIFALSSDFGTYIDGERDDRKPVSNIKKHRLLKMIKELPASAQMIIFHVDMIGEGIDVPGLTGVMPFRNCELAKFVQNIGRASRLHPEDRKRIYAGELGVDSQSTKGWIKPSSWVIIPTFLENSEGFASRFREIIEELRTKFDYVPEQHTVISNVRGLDEDESIDTVNEILKTRVHAHSGLEAFDHEFEKLGLLERIVFDDTVVQLEEKYDKEVDKILNACKLNQ